MRSRASASLVLLCLSVANTAALAERTELDDSLSPSNLYDVELSAGPGGIAQALRSILASDAGGGFLLTGAIPDVEVRLDTRRYVNETVQIYLSLPLLIRGLDSPAGLELSWEATGQFMAGSVRPGQSALIFEGTLTEPVTRASFDFVLRLEDGLAATAFELEPVYEIETYP